MLPESLIRGQRFTPASRPSGAEDASAVPDSLPFRRPRGAAASTPPQQKARRPLYGVLSDPRERATALEIAPRLASWMAQGHPDQTRLASSIDHAEDVLAEPIARTDGPLALRLDVGLPSAVDVLHHHDLDNYAFPLITKLGSRRFACVWATKRTSAQSLIRVDRPRPTAAPGPVHTVRTKRSAETAAWKEELKGQLVGAKEIADGPVELQLAYRVGPQRNWANLWKQTIDALEPLLGSEGRPWHPRDGRIVRLGLHHEVDPDIGHDVEIAIVARPCDISDNDV